MSRKKKLIDLAMIKNTASYRHYEVQLFDLAISLFRWKNLPESVNARYLELCEIERGSCVFFMDDILDEYYALPWVNKGKFNVYGDPIKFNAYSAYNNYRYPLNYKNAVIIWNNHMKSNIQLQIMHYAEILSLIDRIIEVNVNSQKTPVFIHGNNRQRLTLTNLYEQWDGNVPIILGDDSLTSDKIDTFTANSPFVSDKLMDIKSKIWNEALTFLGISNVTFEKSQKMLSDEVQRMLGGTFASRNSRLMSRQDACEKINKKFGLNISVEFNDGVPDELKNMANPPKNIREVVEENE